MTGCNTGFIDVLLYLLQLYYAPLFGRVSLASVNLITSMDIPNFDVQVLSHCHLDTNAITVISG